MKDYKGCICSLKILKLWQGRDPWDIPRYMVLKSNSKYFWITEDGYRIFQVSKEFVTIIP